ncbi:hypothetical protein AAF712_008372 [Marasmius tenuissimus]|uniref:Uncharacterized protein n=1 Tax=Marasmius tenuissimus TaxID=585030 RepID=A0ABR2ZV54_9AGAR
MGDPEPLQSPSQSSGVLSRIRDFMENRENSQSFSPATNSLSLPATPGSLDHAGIGDITSTGFTSWTGSSDGTSPEEPFWTQPGQLTSQSALTLTNVIRNFSVEDGRALKRQKTLSADADREYDEFLNSLDAPASALSRIMLVLLQNRDINRAISEELKQRWTPSDPLLETAKEYGQLTLLSPRIHAYKGTRLALMVVETMRKLGVAELPPPHETGRLAVITKSINRSFTDMRYLIKLKIGQSIYDDEGSYQPTDVGTLLHGCIGTTRAPPLATALARMAFLRSIWLELFEKQRAEEKRSEEGTVAQGATSRGGGKPKNPKKRGFSEKKNQLRDLPNVPKFWDYVDIQLEEMRKLCKTPDILAGAFRKFYDDDIKLYGSSSAPVTEMKDLEDWLGTLHSATASAQQVGTSDRNASE